MGGIRRKCGLSQRQKEDRESLGASVVRNLCSQNQNTLLHHHSPPRTVHGTNPMQPWKSASWNERVDKNSPQAYQLISRPHLYPIRCGSGGEFPPTETIFLTAQSSPLKRPESGLARLSSAISVLTLTSCATTIPPFDFSCWPPTGRIRSSLAHAVSFPTERGCCERRECFWCSIPTLLCSG